MEAIHLLQCDTQVAALGIFIDPIKNHKSILSQANEWNSHSLGEKQISLSLNYRLKAVPFA